MSTKAFRRGLFLTGGYVNLYDLDKYNNFADIELDLNHLLRMP